MSVCVNVEINEEENIVDGSVEDCECEVCAAVCEIGPVGPPGPVGPQGPQGPQGEPGRTPPYTSLRRLDSFLYEITFDKLPDYIPSNEFTPTGCTSFVRDGKLYRNLDWYYGNTAEFKINFKNVEGITFITGLNEGNLDENDTLVSQLPYRICDGRNNSGLMVSTHVIFNDFDYEGSGNKSVDLTLLPFLILTTMKSVDTLSNEIQDLINNVYISPAMAAQHFLIQVLVTDGATTKLFTPTSAGYQYIDISSNPKLTNFKWVNRAIVSRSDDDIQLHPTGIERWNAINDSVTLEDLKFTVAYQGNSRLSEFIGIDNTTKDSTDEELQAIYERAHAAYLVRTRDNTLWQTVHSIVYSNKGIDTLNVQENYNVDFIPARSADNYKIQVFTTSTMKTSTLPSIDVPALTTDDILKIENTMQQCGFAIVKVAINSIISCYSVVAVDHDGSLATIRIIYHDYIVDYTVDGSNVISTYIKFNESK